MKRFVLIGLTAIALAGATAPAFALSDRTEQARQSNLNKLNDRFQTELERNRTNLSDRTEKERQATIDNKLSDRFQSALERNQDRTNLSDRTQRARQANLDK